MFLNSEAINDLKVGFYENLQCSFLGLDSFNYCFDKKYFNNFPYSIEYNFNQIGYRERDILDYNKNAIIAIGDSFTLGLGLPESMLYTKKLEEKINSQVLNFSLNGCSNDWISRKLEIILKYFDPVAIIIHYTFTHRREADRSDWFDYERTLSESIDMSDNLHNWELNHSKICSLAKNIPICFSSIPNWHSSGIIQHKEILPTIQVDNARDGFHYGKETMNFLANKFAEQLINRV